MQRRALKLSGAWGQRRELEQACGQGVIQDPGQPETEADRTGFLPGPCRGGSRNRSRRNIEYS